MKKMSHKIVFAGESGVGKTSIIRRFVDDTYDINGNLPTINVNFYSKSVNVRDNTVRLQLWDTAGHEAYRSISTSYFRNAKMIILVYDVQNTTSFQNLVEWVDIIEESDQSIPWVLFGNKCDLEEINITEEEHNSFCELHDVAGYRGSAKIGTNIEEMFYEVAEKILKSENKENDEPVTLDITKTGNKTETCC
jgi:small GTP-binding protein